jgi:hypothetical protein
MQGVTMSQISPPLRILLIGCVLFLAAWMTVLKPGGATAPAPAPAPAPAVNAGGPAASTSAGKAVESANNTAAAADARAKELTGEDPAAAAAAPTTAVPAKPSTTSSTAPKGDVSKAGLPVPVAKAVAQKKVLVMLFWNPRAADDKVVRNELRSVGSRHKKDVFVHVANVKDIARYAPVTRGAEVQQSPSIVVVDRSREATVLTGYSDRETIRQTVFDALRSK